MESEVSSKELRRAAFLARHGKITLRSRGSFSGCEFVFAEDFILDLACGARTGTEK